MDTEKKSKNVVLTFLKALNEEDFKAAKSCLNDQFKFNGPLGIRNNAEEYMRDMEKMKLKYEIHKVFEDGNDICVIYDVGIGGQTMFTCGLYHLEQNKIKSLRVLFDPRPLLEE